MRRGRACGTPWGTKTRNRWVTAERVDATSTATPSACRDSRVPSRATTPNRHLAHAPAAPLADARTAPPKHGEPLEPPAATHPWTRGASLQGSSRSAVRRWVRQPASRRFHCLPASRPRLISRTLRATAVTSPAAYLEHHAGCPHLVAVVPRPPSAPFRRRLLTGRDDTLPARALSAPLARATALVLAPLPRTSWPKPPR